MLNGLDLFSGIGGLTIALSEWVRPVAYCEIEPYAAATLFSRMADDVIPRAPVFPDIRRLSAGALPGIDIIYGGFPCQDVSTAGLRKGLDGERTGLFREAIRLVRECRPQFVFFENVPGIRRYVPSVRGELEALGYDCRDGFLSAAEVGANHIRNRWWLLAHANEERGREKSKLIEGISYPAEPWNDGEAEHVADSAKVRCERSGKRKGSGLRTQPRAYAKLTRGDSESRKWWCAEPAICRVVNGLPERSHRVAALGNAVVPQCAKKAFKILMGIK